MTETRIIPALLLACFVLHSSASAVPADRSMELMNTGKKLLQEGMPDEGIRKLEEACEADPANMPAKLYLARGYSLNRQWHRARTLFQKIIGSTTEKDDIHWHARYGMALLDAWVGKYERAITQCGYILANYSDISRDFRNDVILSLGDFHSWKVDYATAINTYERILEDDPDNIQALNRTARVYFWEGKYALSREYTRKVLSVDGGNQEANKRLREIELIKPRVFTLGSTTTMYDAKNSKGDPVERIVNHLCFDWQPDENWQFYASATGIVQNRREHPDPDESGRWAYDLNAGIGASGRLRWNTFLGVRLFYTPGAVITPDLAGEMTAGWKINRFLEPVLQYRLTLDRVSPPSHDGKELYHSVSPGATLYFSEYFFTRVQLFIETDGTDRLLSFCIRQTYVITPSDRVGLHVAYGKGRNDVVTYDTMLPRDDSTFGISASYIHYFTTSFGLKPVFGYHNRAKSSGDFNFGLEGVFQF